MAERRKVLRLDRDQARLLASWLRIASYQMEDRAKRMRENNYSPAYCGSLDIIRSEVERARALAARLDDWP